MPRKRLDLPAQRLVNSTVAAQIVGTTKVQFLKEVKHGLWSPPHPCSEFRSEPYWDCHALQRDIDRGSGLTDNSAFQRDKLLRGLGGEKGVA